MSLINELGHISAKDAALRLIGAKLTRIYRNRPISGLIVEAEAYDQSDLASHSFKGITPRTSIMFAEAGHAYVYFSYGLHYCFNVVVGPKGEGSAVLIRALEPLDNIESMKQLRSTDNIHNLCNGPAKLCQALAIDKNFYGHNLSLAPLTVNLAKPVSPNEVIWTKRIGIKEPPGTELYWRVALKNSKYLSRP